MVSLASDVVSPPFRIAQFTVNVLLDCLLGELSRRISTETIPLDWSEWTERMVCRLERRVSWAIVA